MTQSMFDCISSLMTTCAGALAIDVASASAVVVFFREIFMIYDFFVVSCCKLL